MVPLLNQQLDALSELPIELCLVRVSQVKNNARVKALESPPLGTALAVHCDYSVSASLLLAMWMKHLLLFALNMQEAQAQPVYRY